MTKLLHYVIYSDRDKSLILIVYEYFIEIILFYFSDEICIYFYKNDLCIKNTFKDGKLNYYQLPYQPKKKMGRMR